MCWWCSGFNANATMKLYGVLSLLTSATASQLKDTNTISIFQHLFRPQWQEHIDRPYSRGQPNPSLLMLILPLQNFNSSTQQWCQTWLEQHKCLKGSWFGCTSGARLEHRLQSLKAQAAKPWVAATLWPPPCTVVARWRSGNWSGNCNNRQFTTAISKVLKRFLGVCIKGVQTVKKS